MCVRGSVLTSAPLPNQNCASSAEEKSPVSTWREPAGRFSHGARDAGKSRVSMNMGALLPGELGSFVSGVFPASHQAPWQTWKNLRARAIFSNVSVVSFQAVGAD